MEKIKTLLIANRGEIAVRIIRTAKSLGIKTISIYTAADAASLHVAQADEAVLLPGEDSRAYTEGHEILKIASEKSVNAVIPGYGFLSENADFARAVVDAGFAWCGPSPETIEAFGVKHVARRLAEEAGVPIVPGTKDLVASQDDAVRESEKLGFPVMLKATGGGGGMGLVTCASADEVRKSFDTVQSRGEQLFKNSGVFIERYYPASHHIEVQIFGNGLGQAIHFGERECSIQRRHQKVIEECPSPFVEKHPGLREKLCNTAVQLAESVKYASAGTVEYLVDDKTGDLFFLETNTRLQVEHGITELCYGVDLVELMLKQADAQLCGKDGLELGQLQTLQANTPKGHAIEARVYAENPLRGFAPSPGLLQEVYWHETERSRVDTFAFTGSLISSHYDSLIAKVMYHADSRELAIAGMTEMLSRSRISGPPTNLDYLAKITYDDRFRAGHTLTSFLSDAFTYRPLVIDVLSGGAYTTIQDIVGRPRVGMGIPHGGAMDSMALTYANKLVGNHVEEAGLEITLSGPELRFLTDAVIALTGAPMEATIDGKDFPMWTRQYVQSGQKVKLGRTIAGGCRAYLAVYGGFPSIASYFDSKSTSPIVAVGGLQGRPLAIGDLIGIVEKFPAELKEPKALIEMLQPRYENNWTIRCMNGPHDDGYVTSEFMKKLYSTDWKVSHNASRSAIRLIGPSPEWARKDGVEGGSHPSNVVEYGYPLYGLTWTGDDPAIIAPDGPNFGGFVCTNTIISADYWKIGQMKAGDTLRFVRVSSLEAKIQNSSQIRRMETSIISEIGPHLPQRRNLVDVAVPPPALLEPKPDNGILYEREAHENIPRVRYRQGGDQHVIVCYGGDTDHFDLNNKVRVTALDKEIKKDAYFQTEIFRNRGLYNTVPCCNTLTLYYHSLTVDRGELLECLIMLEDRLGDLSTTSVPCRCLKLPLSFSSKEQDEANKRYQETQRPFAPYLPSNFDFVARNNAFTTDELKQCFLCGDFLTVFVGFYCGLPAAIPMDPRKRFFAPKTNPSRVFTPEGTVGLGGGAIAIYPVDSPGGYQMCGRTIPCWDYYGWKEGFSPKQPWAFRDFDLISFYEVSEEELGECLQLFGTGKFRFEWEETEFDMAEHNELLRASRDEVQRLRHKQSKAQNKMIDEEKEALERSRHEKSKSQVDQEIIDELMQDPQNVAIEAPVDANVWKTQVTEGDSIEAQHTIAILEAMKLEINVDVPDDLDHAKVEKVLVKPGDSVKAGTAIALLRRDR